jgi:hypothetical protein
MAKSKQEQEKPQQTLVRETVTVREYLELDEEEDDDEEPVEGDEGLGRGGEGPPRRGNR